MNAGLERRGFTLIELLVVIAVIATIAALVFTTLPGVKRRQYLSVVRPELDQISLGIDEYKTKFGSYPPSNPSNPMMNSLYYELTGVVNIGGDTGSYKTSDGASVVPVNVYAGANVFNTHALNCARTADDLESGKGKSILDSLTSKRIGSVSVAGNSVNLLVTSVGGPDLSYLPLGAGTQGVNPFRYECPGTNNPNSYDLWIDLSISGKINRVSNWSTKVQIF